MPEKRQGVFAQYAPIFEEHGFVALPVVKGGKKPAVKDWMRSANLSAAERESRRYRFPDANIGLLAGTPLSTGRRFGFVDVDHQDYVPFVKCVLAPFASGKAGAKGSTIFCQVDSGLKSTKMKRSGEKAPAVEIFVQTGMTVVPPSLHPSGRQYRWEGKALLDLEHSDLPILDAQRYKIISLVLANRHAREIVDGGADAKGHEAMLSLTSSGIANLTDDLDWLAGCLNALFHSDYQGNTREETRGMLESAKRNRLGSSTLAPLTYDPGEEGPIPLGFTRDGLYAIRDQVRNIIVFASANQLLSFQYLLGLGSSDFWRPRFPSEKGLFNALRAGEALISDCKRAGPFNPIRVRGRGIWREADEIIINLGDPIPPNVKHTYLCFEPIAFEKSAGFDAKRLLELLQRFKWRHPQDAMLLLGWFALAPICGVLSWRPHCFLYGPPRCGKTTIHALAAHLLYPLVISTDGQSSEAGIRQSLGPDSLPIIIDEFESDQQGHSLRGVLRLARSASSADNPVLRGTPEGKAMQFSLRTTFFFCAVNPGRMTPADQTRILLLEMLQHDGDKEVGRQIIEGERFFRDLGPQWCGYMVSRAALLGPALDMIEPKIPSTDRRHRQNFSTVLAAAFIALHGRAPTDEEAQAWAAEYSPAIERHEEEIDRDNSQECLHHLLSHVVDHFPLAHWIAVGLRRFTKGDYRSYDADRIMRIYDIVVKADGDSHSVLIRNGSPRIDEIFQNTIWAGRGWERALRGLPDAFSLKHPVYFGGSGKKSRCVGIPSTYIGDPIDILHDDRLD